MGVPRRGPSPRFYWGPLRHCPANRYYETSILWKPDVLYQSMDQTVQSTTERVRSSIEAMIDNGRVKPGAMLPSERDLSERFSVARGTVRAAISQLVDQGRLVRMARKGAMVAPVARKVGKQNVWAVVVPKLHYFYMPLIAYIEMRARKEGVSVILGWSADSIEIEREQIFRAVENGAQGILLCPANPGGHRPDESFAYLADLPVPVVVMGHWGSELPPAGVDSVLSDNFAGEYQATLHMIRHGYEKISLCGVPDKACAVSHERHEGYISCLLDHDVDRPPLDIVDIRDIEKGQLEGLREHLDWGTQAFVVTNDRAASNLIRCLQQLGLNVPDDIGVIGYDDEQLANLVHPKLSSVRIGRKEIALKAVDILIERIESGQKMRTRSIVVRPKVVARETCGVNCRDYCPEMSDLTEMDMAAMAQHDVERVS